MSKNFLASLHKCKQTVFSISEIAVLFPHLAQTNISRRLNYYVKQGELIWLKRAIYAKPDYSSWELANKLYSPSYISLFTILEQQSLIFQQNATVYLVSYLSRQKTVANHCFAFHKAKSDILLNSLGLFRQNNVWLADKERAFLDTIYFFKDIHIDNLYALDWNKVFTYQSIYQSKALQKRVAEYYQDFKENYVQ